MSLLTILLFIIYTWGFGFSLTRFLKDSGDFFERNIMRIGFGLGFMIFLGVLLNLFGIPIDWKIFLALSSITPVFIIIKNHKQLFENIPLKWKFPKFNISILIVFILFFSTLYMYEKGAFSYPYFEDDDPWGHANSIKYISIEKTLWEPFTDRDLFHYIDAYPPGYDMIMAILTQTSNSLMWTLKFFNSLIISLGILFFYFFVKAFTGSSRKGLIATFALAAVPSYLSHFIWAHGLIVTLFIPAFYCLEKLKEDKRWIIPAAIGISSIFLVQPDQSIKFTILFFIYYFIKVILSKKIYLYHLLSFFLGIALSLLWWIPSIIKKGGITLAASTIGFGQVATVVQQGGNLGMLSLINKIFHNVGTATRLYTFKDFFIAKPQNMINNPIGIGIFLTALIIMSVILILINIKKLKEEKNQWMLIALFWVLFTFLGIHGCTRLPFCLFSFRFWMLFALTSAILIPISFEFILNIFRGNRVIRFVILILLIFVIIKTSFLPKYAVNTAQWGPGGVWTSQEEINGYVWLKNLPEDTKVFPYSAWDAGIIGFDKFSCFWCPEIIEFRKKLPEKSIQELHQFLKINGYGYFIIDGMSARNLQQNYNINDSAGFVNLKISESLNSGLFSVAHQTGGMIVLKVI